MNTNTAGDAVAAPLPQTPSEKPPDEGTGSRIYLGQSGVCVMRSFSPIKSVELWKREQESLAQPVEQPSPADLARRMAATIERNKTQFDVGRYRDGKYRSGNRRMTKTTFKPW